METDYRISVISGVNMVYKISNKTVFCSKNNGICMHQVYLMYANYSTDVWDGYHHRKLACYIWQIFFCIFKSMLSTLAPIQFVILPMKKIQETPVLTSIQLCLVQNVSDRPLPNETTSHYMIKSIIFFQNDVIKVCNFYQPREFHVGKY